MKWTRDILSGLKTKCYCSSLRLRVWKLLAILRSFLQRYIPGSHSIVLFLMRFCYDFLTMRMRSLDWPGLNKHRIYKSQNSKFQIKTSWVAYFFHGWPWLAIKWKEVSEHHKNCIGQLIGIGQHWNWTHAWVANIPPSVCAFMFRLYTFLAQPSAGSRNESSEQSFSLTVYHVAVIVLWHRSHEINYCLSSILF